MRWLKYTTLASKATSVRFVPNQKALLRRRRRTRKKQEKSLKVNKS